MKLREAHGPGNTSELIAAMLAVLHPAGGRSILDPLLFSTAVVTITLAIMLSSSSAPGAVVQEGDVFPTASAVRMDSAYFGACQEIIKKATCGGDDCTHFEEIYKGVHASGSASGNGNAALPFGGNGSGLHGEGSVSFGLDVNSGHTTDFWAMHAGQTYCEYRICQLSTAGIWQVEDGDGDPDRTVSGMVCTMPRARRSTIALDATSSTQARAHARPRTAPPPPPHSHSHCTVYRCASTRTSRESWHVPRPRRALWDSARVPPGALWDSARHRESAGR